MVENLDRECYSTSNRLSYLIWERWQWNNPSFNDKFPDGLARDWTEVDRGKKGRQEQDRWMNPPAGGANFQNKDLSAIWEIEKMEGVKVKQKKRPKPLIALAGELISHYLGFSSL